MQIIDAIDQKQWDNFITSHPESNFLHAWAWGEFHLSRGKTVVRRLALEGENIIAAYIGVVETARRGRYLAIAGGPIMDYSQRQLAQAVFADITEQGRANRCVFVRIRPQLELSEFSQKLFSDLGAKPAPMYLSVEHAGILDLSKSEAEILAGASQRLRRSLRKAAANNISVEVSENPSAIHEFYQIQLETARRQDFVSFSEDFLVKQFTAFAHRGEAKLYTAKYEGKTLAQNFMIFYGPEASYHYGVSTELGTKLSGAPLLHMQAMRDARDLGIQRYNFWGITDEDDTGHRFYGVSQFKRGFGVTDLKYLPAHDLILQPAAYKLSHLIETTRRRHRKV